MSDLDHHRLKRFHMIVYLFVTVKISEVSSVSCSVSPSTVQFVTDCPESEEKWREAAARKNCSAYDNQCDKSERLEYHCVINEYANQTLEVCAYGRIIVSGYCTEYNYIGNRIQQNFRTICASLTQNPCPSGYRSTEAYKYSGCYKLAKGTSKESVTEHTQSTFTIAFRNSSNHIISSRPHEDDTQPTYVIFIATGTATLIVAVATLIFTCMKSQRFRCCCFIGKEMVNVRMSLHL